MESKLLIAAQVALELMQEKQAHKATPFNVAVNAGVSKPYAIAAIKIARAVNSKNTNIRYVAVVEYFKKNKSGSLKALAEFLQCEYHLASYAVVKAKKNGDLPSFSFSIEQAGEKCLHEMRRESLWNGVSMRLLSVPFTEFSNTLNTLDYQRRI